MSEQSNFQAFFVSTHGSTWLREQCAAQSIVQGENSFAVQHTLVTRTIPSSLVSGSPEAGFWVSSARVTVRMSYGPFSQTEAAAFNVACAVRRCQGQDVSGLSLEKQREVQRKLYLPCTILPASVRGAPNFQVAGYGDINVASIVSDPELYISLYDRRATSHLVIDISPISEGSRPMLKSDARWLVTLGSRNGASGLVEHHQIGRAVFEVLAGGGIRPPRRQVTTTDSYGQQCGVFNGEKVVEVSDARAQHGLPHSGTDLEGNLDVALTVIPPLESSTLDEETWKSLWSSMKTAQGTMFDYHQTCIPLLPGSGNREQETFGYEQWSGSYIRPSDPMRGIAEQTVIGTLRVECVYFGDRDIAWD